ncbi:MAG: xylose isomerase, partial [Bacteroidota bacterium]
SFNEGAGKDFENGNLDLEALRDLAIKNGEPEVRSGRQEYLENLLNRFI